MKQIAAWSAWAMGLLAVAGCGGSAVNPIGGGPSQTSNGGSASGGSVDSGTGGRMSTDTGTGGTETGTGGTGTGGTETGIGGTGSGYTGTPAGGSSPADHGGGGSTGAPPIPHIVDPVLAAQVAGTWTGYVENYAFQDNADQVTLVLDSEGTGHATFGNSAPPPPPTDPTVGYPPSYQMAAASGNWKVPSDPYPGLAFTIQNVALQNSRLQFDISTSQLWTTWCLQQTPTRDEQTNSYRCDSYPDGTIPPLGDSCTPYNPSTMKPSAIDCSKWQLCQVQLTCACTVQGCSAPPNFNLHFDISINLPKADGSVRGLADGSLHNVHLTKG